MCFNCSLATRYEISHGHSQRVGPEPVEGEIRETRWSGGGSKGEKSSELGCYRPSEVVGDTAAGLSFPASAAQPPQVQRIKDAAISRVDMAASYWRKVLRLDGKGFDRMSSVVCLSVWLFAVAQREGERERERERLISISMDSRLPRLRPEPSQGHPPPTTPVKIDSTWAPPVLCAVVYDEIRSWWVKNLTICF
ncbi:hypothetical protein BO86DRAFT_230981 [Aspergillus japonicus CBS 114.51]|uniref:Uncharacterized protein n=1 Tax=Aspergillus japonicus CBS 114.51 TaxID=1448312 RepID=A0A8T8X9S9_ASPJA|nr:hypothetical protein BO86DRAFT_230981 [Aspergillus japonicus CBS 114.51]RAH84795.1 hypothetical protein BO86DRAFT_230981 [Aspergillus japonicus CBS 114.51]